MMAHLAASADGCIESYYQQLGSVTDIKLYHLCSEFSIGVRSICNCHETRSASERETLVCRKSRHSVTERSNLHANYLTLRLQRHDQRHRAA